MLFDFLRYLLQAFLLSPYEDGDIFGRLLFMSRGRYYEQSLSLLGTRTLLGAPGRTTRSDATNGAFKMVF